MVQVISNLLLKIPRMIISGTCIHVWAPSQGCLRTFWLGWLPYENEHIRFYLYTKQDSGVLVGELEIQCVSWLDYSVLEAQVGVAPFSYRRRWI